MADLFAMRVETRESLIQSMSASTTIDFIDATRRTLPCGHRFAHTLLEDIRDQLTGGYRMALSARQTRCVLRFADEAGVSLSSFTTKEPQR